MSIQRQRWSDITGGHALESAAQEGHLPVVQQLVAIDPDLVALPGLNNRSVLAAAAYGGRGEVVQWLLQAHPERIDLRWRDADGGHALDSAAQEGHLRIVQQLATLDPGLITLPGLDDRLALDAAMSSNHDDVVAWLREMLEQLAPGASAKS